MVEQDLFSFWQQLKEDIKKEEEAKENARDDNAK